MTTFPDDFLSSCLKGATLEGLALQEGGKGFELWVDSRLFFFLSFILNEGRLDLHTSARATVGSKSLTDYAHSVFSDYGRRGLFWS